MTTATRGRITTDSSGRPTCVDHGRGTVVFVETTPDARDRFECKTCGARRAFAA